MTPRVSVIVTAYNEGEGVLVYLNRLLEAVTLPCEILIVCDSPDDTTIPFVEAVAKTDPVLFRCSTRTVVDQRAPSAMAWTTHERMLP